MDFNTLKDKYNWKDIHGCPGRFRLIHENKSLTIEELLNEKVNINSFYSEDAKDEVLVVKFKDGGIISYKRKDGTFIHTLNTIEGFTRKLEMLNIILK